MVKTTSGKKRGGILKKVIIAIVALMVISALGRSRSREEGLTNDDAVTVQTQDAVQDQASDQDQAAMEDVAPDQEADAPSDSALSIADEVDSPEIAEFIREYNGISASPFLSVEQIGTNGYQCESYGYEVILTITPNGSVFTVTINDNGDYEGMRQTL